MEWIGLDVCPGGVRCRAPYGANTGGGGGGAEILQKENGVLRMECSLDCSQVCSLECSQTCSLECSVGVLFRPYSCQQLTAYGYREFMNQRSANVTSCFFLAHNNHKNLDQFQNWIDPWYIVGLAASTNNGVSGSRILGIKGPLLTYNSTSWRVIPRSNAKSFQILK